MSIWLKVMKEKDLVSDLSMEEDNMQVSPVSNF